MSAIGVMVSYVARKDERAVGVSIAINQAIAEVSTAAAIQNFSNGAIKDGTSNLAAATSAAASIISSASAGLGKRGKAFSYAPDRIAYTSGLISTALSYIDIDYEEIEIRGLRNLAKLIKDGDEDGRPFPGTEEEKAKKIKDIERKIEEIKRKRKRKSRGFLY